MRRCHFILLLWLQASGAWAATGCPVSPFIAPPSGGLAGTLEADQAALAESGLVEASGSVRLEKGKQALEAPQLSYNRTSGRALAREGLKYYRPGLNVTAEQADVNINQETGRFQSTRFALGTGGRGNAGEIQALGAGRYRLNQADYSTCAGTDKAWQVSADELELDRASGRGEAYDAVLRLFGWPVFYTPYFNFPIDDKRHTGFLLPVFGQSSDSGFELAAPYYINLAPQYDATLTPRLLSDRGLQLGGQFRYLHAHHRGTLAGEFLPSDNAFDDQDRSLLHFDHEGRFGRHLGIQAEYTKVSDDDYFEDLDNNLARTSQSQLERALRITLARPGARFAALLQNFQTLSDDRRSGFRTEPFERLPQTQLALLSPTRPWQAALDAQFVNFSRENSIEGQRYDLRPRLLWGIDRQAWYLDTEAAYRYTRYQLDRSVAGNDERPDRSIPSFSAETGLRFQRPLGDGWLQTLEPRAFYLFNAFEDQSDLPVFDTGTPNLHFERLFADNRFVGGDRIGDANQVTLALTSRFLDANTGRTVVKLDLGRVYGFRDLRVQLPQQSVVGYGERHSDIVANAQYNPTQHWRAGTTLQYDPDSDRLNRGAVRLGYRGDQAQRIDLGYRFYRDFRPALSNTGAANFETLEQTDIRVVQPLGDAFKLLGRWNYSLQRNQSVETLAGLRYRASCCWALQGAWRRYINDEQGNYDTAILLQIELTGLGRFGDDIERLVERDIVDNDFGFNDIRFP